MDELELEDGDGFDDFAKAGSRQTIYEEFEASGGQLPRYSKTGPGSPTTDYPTRKLADLRWRDHLDPNEKRDVIRAARAGDPAAKERLVRCFQKAIIEIAGRRKYGGPPFDDRLAAAWEGFWRAVAGFDLNRNNGIWAYAQKFIDGAIVDLVHDWHQRGGKLETRAERENRKNGDGFRPICTGYNGVEGRYDEDGHDAEGRHNGKAIYGHIADDREFRIWDEATAGAQLRIKQRLAKIGRRLGVPRECIGVDE